MTLPHEPSSNGLRPQTAAALAYAGWWMTGAIFWFVERHDKYVRFHAAQSLAAFGLLAIVILGFFALAAVSLSFMPAAFSGFMWAAGLTWIGATALWGVAIWKAVNGDAWHIPVAGELADKLVGV